MVLRAEGTNRTIGWKQRKKRPQKEGALIGEMALIDESPRAANAVAKSVRTTAPAAFPRTGVFGSWTETAATVAPLHHGFSNPL
jgi:hypothetical protein